MPALVCKFSRNLAPILFLHADKFMYTHNWQNERKQNKTKITTTVTN